jgi:hypothetical protein
MGSKITDPPRVGQLNVRDTRLRRPACCCAGIILSFALLIAFCWFEAYPLAKAIMARPGPSDAALVDQAMVMPGAIVISPHRDLVEMGIIHAPTPVYTAGPAIAIHTRKQWCIWSLGHDATPIMGGTSQSEYGVEATIFGNWHGYPAAFADFKKCVQDENASFDSKTVGNALHISDMAFEAGSPMRFYFYTPELCVKMDLKSGEPLVRWHPRPNGTCYAEDAPRLMK